MRTCPKCGWTIVVDPETGCLLTHGPETIVGPYNICPGSGLQVEPPTPSEHQPT